MSSADTHPRQHREGGLAAVGGSVNGGLPAGSSLGQATPGSLPAELFSLTAGVASTRHLVRHDVLYCRGDPAREMFVIQSGAIAVSSCASDGREALIALLGRGELFGLCSFFDGRRRSTQARALEPSSVLAVPFEPVRRVLEQRPALIWGLARLVSERLRELDQALADTVFLDVTGRTAKRLLQFAGDAEEFQLPVTQEELAAFVGASRERVNKSISTFVRLGWLEQRDRRYKLLDRDQLEARAGCNLNE